MDDQLKYTTARAAVDTGRPVEITLADGQKVIGWPYGTEPNMKIQLCEDASVFRTVEYADIIHISVGQNP